MKLDNIFNIIQGHQITDEEIYKSQGEIPILTGKNEIKGFWNKKLIEDKDLPCISYPTKANSGEAYVQDKIFDANNTAILIPYVEWKEKIDLSWFAYRLSRLFPDIQTSKECVSYLNKEIVKEIDFDIPKKEEQIEEYKSISKILKIKSKLIKIVQKINKIEESDLIIQYKKYQKKNYLAEDIFDCVGGNSGLTEQYIYQNLQNVGERKYILLTGSIKVDEKEKISLFAKPKDKSKKIIVFSGEGIHVIRKGMAGKINYLKKGEYTLNDDAYILKVKKEFPLKLSLKWFTKVYAKVFMEFSSQSDNSTWNKDYFMENAKFDIPILDEQENMLKKFEKIEEYKEICNKILNKIELVLSKEITHKL